MMKKVITLEIGNSSWWKNKKYRKEASLELKKLRKKYKSVKLIYSLFDQDALRTQISNLTLNPQEVDPNFFK